MSSNLLSTYGERPVTFVRGQGTVLVDEAGRDYLDFLSGIAVTSLGHAHPAVTEAIAAQAGTLSHVSNLFGNSLAEEVAGALDRLLGGGTTGLGGKVFFANSGTEANECAFKIARKYHGEARHGVIAMTNSFHGRTMASLAATGQPTKHAGFHPLPQGFTHVAFDDLEAVAASLENPVNGAVLVEVIQGEGGVVVPSADYLGALRQLCDRAGALLLIDEIQTGLGRCGAWFSFQDFGIIPDVVTSAKALGNGMPIGACWARPEVAPAFRPGDHGSTFGGQPLALSAAKATLAELERIDAPALARAQGAMLVEGLGQLDGVSAVRGRGLLLGAVVEVDAGALARAALAHGLVVNAVTPTTIRFAPPLNVTAAEVTEGIARFSAALAHTLGAQP